MEINFLKIASATLLVFLSGLLRESDCLAQTIRSSTQRELKIVDPTSITGQGIGIRAAAGTNSYTLTFPTTAPTLNQNLSASAINGGNITLTWNTPLTATAGTTNYIPKFTSSNTIGNSQLFDDGTIAFLGNGDVNTAPSTAILSSTGGSGTNIAGAEFRLRGGASTGSAAGGPITFYTSAAGTAGTSTNTATERARITSAGRLLLGTSAESTFLLDVNGTARFFNNLTSTSSFSISGIHPDGRMALYSTNSSGTIQLLSGWGGMSGGSATLFPGNVNSLGLLGAVGYFNGQLALQSHVVGTGFVNSGTHKSLAIVTPQSPITVGGWSPSADFNDILTFSCATNTWSGTRPNLRYTALSHVFRVNNGTGQNNPGTTALYIDSTGNVGIGILNPIRPLHLDKGNATASYLQYTAGTTTGQTVNDGFHVGIDNTGLAILNQQENLGLQVMTNNTTRLTIAAGGDATFTGSVTGTSFFESSDSRLKDLIKRDGDVAYFTWKDKRDTKTHIGYLAQEIQQHMPDQVKADENGFLSVNYIEVLVAKIRLLEKKIEELEKKNKRHEKK